MCKALGISFVELVNDMPVRWGSTDKLVKAALKLEQAIRAVLYRQTWDPSVREHLTPTDADWDMLKEMSVFLDIFARPTVQSQAEKYPTLHNVIPDYLHMLRSLNVYQEQDTKPFLKTAAIAAHEVLLNYYKKSLQTRHHFVATICDPRYKLNLLEYIYDAEGGTTSTPYKKAKAHFEHTYSQYRRRATAIAVIKRAREVAAATAIRPTTPEFEEAWRQNPIHGYAQHVASQRVEQPLLVANTELERWFREPVVDTNISHADMKVYMQRIAHEFPIISQMARDYLAIPATSAPSERVFSVAGNLISKKRTRISSENVRYVLCLRSWGFLVEDDEEEDILFDANGFPIFFDDTGVESPVIV